MANIGGKYFAPKPGRYGTTPEIIVAGGVNEIGLISNAFANLAVNIPLPYARMRCLRFSVATRVVPGVSTATSSMTCLIRKISGGVTTNLTSTLALNALTANVSVPFVVLSTLAPSDLVLKEGDVLQALTGNNVTITTLPTDLAIMAEVSMAE